MRYIPEITGSLSRCSGSFLLELKSHRQRSLIAHNYCLLIKAQLNIGQGLTYISGVRPLDHTCIIIWENEDENEEDEKCG